MANEKNEVKKTGAAAAAIEPSYMPEGYSDADFHVVGGFTPMYKPKNAFDGKWKPVFGWGAYIEALPEIEDKSSPTGKRTPLVANIILVAPNQGILGDRSDEKTEAIAAGENILVPVGGNLLWNKPFMAAMFDPKHYWLVRMTVTGQVPSDFPSDMWTWKVEIAAKPKLRKDHPILSTCETALSPEVIAKLDERQKKPLPSNAFSLARSVPILGTGGRTASGEVYDKDGVLQGRLVGGNASA